MVNKNALNKNKEVSVPGRLNQHVYLFGSHSPSKMDPGWKGRQMATLKIGSRVSGEGDDEAQPEVTLVATRGTAGTHEFITERIRWI